MLKAMEILGVELKDEVLGIIRFGSRVKGYFRESSDEDFLVITKKENDVIFRDGKHILIISLQDFIEEILKNSPLISAILSGYEIVYAKYPVYFWIERAEELLKKAKAVHVDKSGVHNFA